MSTQVLWPQEPIAVSVQTFDMFADINAEMPSDKDLRLCMICLQWTCDGPRCHRPDVCEPKASQA